MREITGHTRIYGILADPIYHVKAPQLMNPVFEAQGFDGVMVPIHVKPEDLGTVLAGLRTQQNFGGFVAILISGFVLDYGKAIHAQKLGTTSDLLVGTGLKDGLMIGYQINFLVFAAVYVIGVLCWLRIDASKPAADD